MKIKDKLAIIFLLFSVVPLSFLGLYAIISSGEALRLQAGEYVNNTLNLTAILINQKTETAFQGSRSIAGDSEIYNAMSRRAEPLDLDMIRDERDIQLRMTNVRVQNPDIRAIYLISDSYPILVNGIPTTFESDYFREEFVQTDLYRRLVTGPGLPLWVNGLEGRFDRIYLMRKFQNLITGRNLGVLIIALDENIVSDLFEQALGQTRGEMLLLDANGMAFSAYPRALRGTQWSGYNGATPGQVTESADRLEMDLPIRHGWKLRARMSLEFLLSNTRFFGLGLGLLAALLIALALTLSLRLTLHFYNPIQTMLDAMKQAEEGSFTPVKSERKDEFSQLFTGYNVMVRRLSRLFEDLNESLQENEEHKREMVAYNQRLESLVQERTQELVQAEKMASLGGLVAGVAHEINTPLGIGITSVSFIQERADELNRLYRESLMRKTDLDDYFATTEEAVALATKNLRRAAELVSSFKRVAVDQSREDLQVFNLRENLSDIILSLKPRLSRTELKLELDCPEDLEVRSYPGVFYQIYSNLILNSYYHGFDEGKIPGSIVLRVIPDSQDLVLDYQDSGKGMDSPTCAKVFEPFFTTRRSQGGTGLGMHIVFNLVNQKLRGKIHCESSPGQGARFVLAVPWAECRK